MRITGVTTCVQYADLLEQGLAWWNHGLDDLVVITSPSDTDTLNLLKPSADKGTLRVYQTDIFHANGAAFNKWAAIDECVLRLGLLQPDISEWLLFFDADMVPPMDWRQRLESDGLIPGKLYGSYRYYVPEGFPLVLDRSKRMPQSWVIGFFTLFNVLDPNVPRGPHLFDPSFPHAGNSDTLFTRRWPYDRQIILDLDLIHIGRERQNWMGRHRKDDLKQLLSQRSGHEAWDHERMPNPPEIK